MKKKIFKLIVVLLILFAYSCAGITHLRIRFPDPFAKKRNKRYRRASLIRQVPRRLTPMEMNSHAISCYETARKYETSFYKTNNTEHAKIAIENYRKSYKLAPSGTQSCIALLKCAELLHHIGYSQQAKQELEIVKRRRDFKRHYRKEIDLIHDLLYNK